MFFAYTDYVKIPIYRDMDKLLDGSTTKHYPIFRRVLVSLFSLLAIRQL